MINDDSYAPWNYYNPNYESWTVVHLSKRGVGLLIEDKSWNMHDFFQMPQDFIADTLAGEGYYWRLKIKDKSKAAMFKLMFGGDL